jgi:hypothetical protein
MPLLLSRYGADDYQDFAQRFPEAVDLLARGILALMASVRRRLWRNVVRDNEPFMIADQRQPQADRKLIAKKIARQNVCCASPGLSRDFLRRLPAAATVTHERASTIYMQYEEDLLIVAWFFLCLLLAWSGCTPYPVEYF